MEYYLDSNAGCDGHDGLSPDTAWRTLERVQAARFMPGDRLLLRRGCGWRGQLSVAGNGAPESPCVIMPYGEGDARPRLDGGGEVESAILLYNVEGWEIRGLEVTNTGESPAVRRMGILAQLENYGRARHIVIEDNYIHDVNGSNVKTDGDWAGGIIWRASGKKTPSWYEGVTVQGNRLERCDRVGIFCRGMGMRDAWRPMLGVRIAHNTLRDIGGDGILNIGTEGCVVERNRLLGGRMRDNMYCAGIWPWSADGTLIRYNEVSGYRGTMDGQGFDCDYNCVGTTHQYNYSHDNEGGYILVCTAGAKYNMPRDIGTYGSTIARNLTVNDLCRTFHLAGPVAATTIAENCVYVGDGIDIPCVLASGYAEPMGGPEETLFLRNIFAARGTLRYARATERLDEGLYGSVDDPAIAKLRFSGNHYLGRHVARPKDDAPPAYGHVTLEALEELLLDADGRAKPGLATLDAYLDFMGWPKA